MTIDDFTNEELLAYIDERLPAGRATELERQLRLSTPLLQRVVQLMQSVEHGEVTLGAMWRRGRWSCPPRAVWAGFLDGRLGDGLSQYLRFHLETAGCRLCEACVCDLNRGGATEGEDRVQKIFQSSTGALQSRQ
jgi:anti-sigma factor RsiW